MKNSALTMLLCNLMFLLLLAEISAAELYEQGDQVSGYNSGWAGGMQSYNGYNQQNVCSGTPCNEACQSGDCRVVSDRNLNNNGVPRTVQVLIPVTELVNDIQRIKQTIVTPVCDQTTLIHQPYSTLKSGTEETIQSKECVDDGNGNCVPAIPGSPSKPIEVNGTTIMDQARNITSNECHNEVNVTILPQVIQREATTYKIVRFTWMDYVNTEIIKTSCRGTPQVTRVMLPPTCTYCGPQRHEAFSPPPCLACPDLGDYQYGSPYERGGFEPELARVGRWPVPEYVFVDGY